MWYLELDPGTEKDIHGETDEICMKTKSYHFVANVNLLLTVLYQC